MIDARPGPGRTTMLVLVGVAIGALGLAAALVDARALSVPFSPPSAAHWLGTDALGRDVAARIAAGAGHSILVGTWAALVTTTLGAVLGGIAGLRGGLVDRVLSSAANAVASIPPIVAMLGIGLVLAPGVTTLGWAIGLSQWVGAFRAIRSEAARLRAADFVRAAFAMGATPRQALVAHVLPHTRSIVATTFVLQFAWAVQAEAALSFFGLAGDAPSWGAALAAAPTELARGIWWPATIVAGLLFSLLWAADAIARPRTSSRTGQRSALG